MIDELLEKFVKDKIREMSLTDKITGFLVKKKKRGTYQSVQESKEIENDLTNKVVQYMKEWMTNETIDGFIRKRLDPEIKSQVELELSSIGLDKVDV
jgi:hypothetical protein